MTERYPTDAIPDRPEFAIRIEGESIAPAVRRDVVEIDVHEVVKRHAMAQILIQNWDPDTQQTRHTDQGLFEPGASIEILLGYHSELSSVFEGVVTGLSSRFSARRAAQLVVEARSRSILMAHPPRSRAIEELSDGEIVDLIASDYDLTTERETGATHESLLIRRGTDWDWILDRAESFGWVAYVRANTLVVRAPAEPTADDVELRWGLNLSELRFDEDVRRIADPAYASAWDPEGQEVVEADTDAASIDVEHGERPDHGDALGDLPRRQVNADTPFNEDSATVSARADGAARNSALRHISGSGSTIGVPALRIDSWLTLTGVGDRNNGSHYLTAVRHRLGPTGYTTEFEFGFPHPLRPRQPPTQPPVTIGVIEDLEDPLGWARVKVGFPWILEAPEPVWARLATLDAGAEFGTVFVPEVGQEVVVSFIGPDWSQPVIIGSLWNGQTAIPEKVTADNDVRAIVTRSGHRLRFHDGSDALIELESAGGSKVLIDDANAAIQLTEAGGSSIKIDGEGIALNAASGDIVLHASAGKIKVAASGMETKTTGPTKLESTATLDVKASATLALKGALVNIN